MRRLLDRNPEIEIVGEAGEIDSPAQGRRWRRRGKLSSIVFLLMATSTDLLAVLERRFIKVNSAVVESLGYSPDELLETDFKTITHPEDIEPGIDLMRRILAGGHLYEQERRRPHGPSVRTQILPWLDPVLSSEESIDPHAYQ